MWWFVLPLQHNTAATSKITPCSNGMMEYSNGVARCHPAGKLSVTHTITAVQCTGITARHSIILTQFGEGKQWHLSGAAVCGGTAWYIHFCDVSSVPLFVKQYHAFVLWRHDIAPQHHEYLVLGGIVACSIPYAHSTWLHSHHIPSTLPSACRVTYSPYRTMHSLFQDTNITGTVKKW